MNYKYKALDRKGREIEGIISSISIAEAKKTLKEKGLIPLDIREGETEKLIRASISELEIYRLFHQLSLLLETGVTIESALSICKESTTDHTLRESLEQILENIRAGKDLSLSFYETGTFSPLVISLIKIGEKTGALKDTFSNLAEYYYFTIQLKNEIKNTLTYPIFLIIASFLSLIGIFKFILPKFFSIFGQEIENLPLISKILYNFTLILNIKFLLFIAFFTSFTFILFKYNPSILIKIRSFVINKLIFFPLLKKIFYNYELSRWCFAMSTMLKNKLEFLESLFYATELLKNKDLANALQKALPKIREGHSISQVFNQIEILPQIVKGTIKIGEESGKLAEVFFELYRYFDLEFKNNLRRFISLLEPIIITFMGIIIGIIVLSLILTIMSVSNIKL